VPSCCVICILVFAPLSSLPLSLSHSLPFSLPLSNKLYFSMIRGPVNKESKCITRTLNNRRKCPKSRKSCLQIDRVRRMFLTLQGVETSSCLCSLRSGIWNLWRISPLLWFCPLPWDLGCFCFPPQKIFFLDHEKRFLVKRERLKESLCVWDPCCWSAWGLGAITFLPYQLFLLPRDRRDFFLKAGSVLSHLPGLTLFGILSKAQEIKL